MEENKYWMDWYSDYVKHGQNVTEPISDIIYAVIDSVDIDSTTTTDRSNTVGVLITTIYWRDVLEGILPINEDGIIIVFQNPCCPSFTYQLK
jgi:hypothetical protein